MSANRRPFRKAGRRALRQFQLRYILGKLTQYVDRSAYGVSAQATRWLSRYCDGANVHIEHILPQSPGDDVRREFGEGADDAELLWSIGNLALAEKAINTSLGRKPFAHKRTVYPKSQFLLTRVIGEKPEIGQTAIDKAVANMKPFATWTRSEVIQRNNWLTLLAKEAWGIRIF